MVPSIPSSRTRRARCAVVLGAGLSAGLAVVLMFASPALATVTGTVKTSGPALNVRSSPSTSASVVASVANGGSVSIDCQTYGDIVTGTYGTSTVWDHLPQQGGYVSDAYVFTGSDGLVAPLCAGATSCANSFGNPNTCAAAVSWAESHISTAYHADYDGRCDHVMALAYGWSASGSTTAYAHWQAVPGGDRHPGVTSVPAGGLAFFSGGSSGYGHVMLSVGGGTFASTDIGGAGTFTYTTIGTIESTWGESYLGWTQPWFQIDH